MKMKSNCPVNFGLEHFGDKWSLLILRDLIFREKRHYNEFLNSDELISTRVLRDRLISLQESGIVIREPDTVKKSRVRYSLTRKGIALVPSLIELIFWAMNFDPNGKKEDFLDKLVASNKDEFASKLMESLEDSHLTKKETNANNV